MNPYVVYRANGQRFCACSSRTNATGIAKRIGGYVEFEEEVPDA